MTTKDDIYTFRIISIALYVGWGVKKAQGKVPIAPELVQHPKDREEKLR